MTNMTPIQTPTVPSPGEPMSTRRVLAILAALGGAFLILCSLCGGLVYLLLPFRSPRGALATNTTIGAVAALAFFYGLLAVLLALPTLWRRAAPRFALPSPWIFLALFVVVVAAGLLILNSNLAAPFLFPPWHVLASGMLPIAVLAYAARRLPSSSAPTVLGEIAWGGVGTLLPAVVFELVIGVFILIGGSLLALLVVGPDRINELITRLAPLQRGAQIDPNQILPLFSGEPGIVIVAVLAAVVYLSGVVPVVEETLKSLGPALAIWRYRPDAGRALLWGLAAGAGYAFSENVLNGTGSLNSAGSAACLWGPVIVLRAGTSLVHMAATATVTLGWHSALVQHRRRRFVLFFFAALAAHGLWNLVSIGLGAALNETALCADPAAALTGTRGLATILAVAILALMIAVCAVWIALLVHRVRVSAAPVAPGPQLA